MYVLTFKSSMYFINITYVIIIMVIMHKEISSIELRQNLADVLNQVNYKNETFIITKNGKPTAALIDLETLNKLKDLQPDNTSS